MKYAPAGLAMTRNRYSDAGRTPRNGSDASWYGRRLGHGKGYVYPHDDPRGFETDNLPDKVKGRRYYEPKGSGEEGERD